MELNVNLFVHKSFCIIENQLKSVQSPNLVPIKSKDFNARLSVMLINTCKDTVCLVYHNTLVLTHFFSSLLTLHFYIPLVIDMQLAFYLLQTTTEY